MSAYICSPETFAILAAYAVKSSTGYGQSDNVALYEWRADGLTETAQEVSKRLARENIRSVSARYPNDKDGQRPGPALLDSAIEEAAAAWAGHYLTAGFKISAVEVLTLCRGYTYQACETEDWITSLAAVQISWIEGKAIRSLPGSDDAPREWHDKAEPYGVKVVYEGTN
jgi:hypothetical protein